MVFVKKSVQEKKEKISKAAKLRHERNRQKKKNATGEMVSVGRRVVDLARIANSMWCDPCDIPLSFRFMEEEKIRGLHSTFKVRCSKCLELYDISSSSSLPDSTGDGHALASVNCKAALGCIDSGVGHEQFNKLMSAMNLPVIHRNTMKIAEERVGPFLEEVAAESCREAIEEERRLTILKRCNSAQPPAANGGQPQAVHGDQRQLVGQGQPPGAAGGVQVGQPPGSSPSSAQPPAGAPSPSEPPSTPKRGRPRLRLPSRSAGISDLSRLKEFSSLPPVSSMEDEDVEITVKYDFGWDKRGSGFKYDSHSGRGSIIGELSKKVLGVKVMSSYCYLCARGLKKENHVCAKNYEGSSKGMEPVAAVDLCVHNPDLKNAGVRVTSLVADRDASTIAAIRRETSYPIKKIVDINHNTKGVNNALWELKKKKHTFLSTAVINHLKRSVNCAIKQNKDDVDAVRFAIMNVADHNFGVHDNCGSWCKAQGDPNYLYQHLPDQKPFSCPVWKEDFVAILQKQADEAESLAPAGSSLQNESYNHMVNTRAPKSRHYGGTRALVRRVSAATACKNLGADYLERVFLMANLSPSTSSYRKSLEHRRQAKAAHQNLPAIKKRRLQLKMKKDWKDANATRAQGFTYVSGMSSTMERAVAAASVDSWMPEPSPLQQGCSPVIVDIETTGLHAAAEIVQLSAKCGENTFNVYILPRSNFNAEAAAVTGMSIRNGHLWQHGKEISTIPAKEAATKFLAFLKQCSSQVILVGHNIVRFDAPRILKLLRDHGLAKELCSLVFGFTDTLPLLKQGKIRKQDELAAKYLTTAYWKNLVKNAHDALTDCILLGGLLQHFKISDADLKTAVLPVRDFMERQAVSKKKKANTPALLELKQHGVSAFIIGKLAASGVTVEELVSEYITHERKGLEVCLGVQVGGKPRVTKNKTVVDNIEKFIKSKVKG